MEVHGEQSSVAPSATPPLGIQVRLSRPRQWGGTQRASWPEGQASLLGEKGPGQTDQAPTPSSLAWEQGPGQAEGGSRLRLLLLRLSFSLALLHPRGKGLQGSEKNLKELLH